MKDNCMEVTLYIKAETRLNLIYCFPVSIEEYEELKVWLKYNKEPVPVVIENWTKTSKLRLEELQSKKYANIHDIVNDWPAYKLSFGYKLVSCDPFYDLFISLTPYICLFQIL